MNKNKIQKNFFAFLESRKGSISAILALMLPIFIGCAALVIDLAHLWAVEGELKNAADASALSGANGLVNTKTFATIGPNWSDANIRAESTIKNNYVDQQQIQDYEIKTGYWLINPPQPPQKEDPFKNTHDAKAFDSTYVPVAAVQVTVTKIVKLWFAPAIGTGIASEKPLSAKSVAAISYPGAQGKGSVLPLAALKSIVNQYWNNDTPFYIGSGDSNGQWTSFKVDNNSASYISSLIANGNPASLQEKDQIYIQSGVKASNYGDLASWKNKTRVIPLVNNISSGYTPITGFIAYKILDFSQSEKWIYGKFDKSYVINTSTGYSGSGYNATNHSILVQ